MSSRRRKMKSPERQHYWIGGDYPVETFKVEGYEFFYAPKADPPVVWTDPGELHPEYGFYQVLGSSLTRETAARVILTRYPTWVQRRRGGGLDGSAAPLSQ